MNNRDNVFTYSEIRSLIRKVNDSAPKTKGEMIKLSLYNDLTDRQRDLVMMYYVDQMRMCDIAEELGIHISTVSRTLKRARNNMSEHLQYSYRLIEEAFLDELGI